MNYTAHVLMRPGRPDALSPLRPTNPALAYLARLASGSRRAQHQSLRVLAGHLAPGLSIDTGQFPWHRVTPEAASLIRARIVQDYAPATARRHMAAFRGVIKECWRAGLLDRDRMERIIDLPPVRGSRPRTGRLLEPWEIVELHHHATPDERALLSLLLDGGLRRAEVGALTPGDVKRMENEARQVLLRVLGKGGKARTVIFGGTAAQRVGTAANWAEIQHQRDHLLPWRAPSIPKVLRRLAKRAGVAPFTAHDCRRTYISRALGKADIATVQAAAGHADPRTTASYDRRGEDAQRRLAEDLASGA